MVVEKLALEKMGTFPRVEGMQQLVHNISVFAFRTKRKPAVLMVQEGAMPRLPFPRPAKSSGEGGGKEGGGRKKIRYPPGKVIAAAFQ